MRLGLGYILLLSTWGFLIVAWFFPGFIRVVGALLLSLADASESMKAWFREYRNGAEVPADDDEVGRRPPAATAASNKSSNPVHREVIEALISQGSPKRKAEVLVMRAAEQLPENASFADLFRKAVAA